MRRVSLRCVAVVLLLLMMMPCAQAQALDFTYTNTGGTITITGYTGTGGAVTIPGTIIGLPVTSIGDRAFYNSTGLTSVVIPNGVTNIGNQAFSDTTSLMDVSIPESLAVIGDDAFAGCAGLRSVKIPTSVTDLGLEAFLNCSSLARLSIGTGITSLNGTARPSETLGVFENCSNLTSLVIPDNVTNIGNGPGSLFGADGAFCNCTLLTNVTIGKGLAYLGLGTFNNCTNLVGIYFRGNAPTTGYDVIGDDTFNHDPATVFYLPGTTGWGSTFAGLPTKLWNPQVQTSDAIFGVRQHLFGFNIAGTADIPLVVEASPTLDPRSWVALQNCTLTNGLIYFSNPQWTNHPNLFYRIRSP